MSEINVTELSGLVSASEKEKKKLYKNQAIISIDDAPVRTVKDEVKETYLELADSLATKRHLTGTVSGTDMVGDTIMAIITYKKFKVLIPIDEFNLMLPEEILGKTEKAKNDFKKMLLEYRLWSEVDFVIKGIDEGKRIAIASRKEAMNNQIKEYYFTPHLRTGEYKINEGSIVEGRIVDVNKNCVNVEVFGIECLIGFEEISYNRIASLKDEFRIGDRILVKIIGLERSVDGGKAALNVEASIKQAQADEREHIISTYKIGTKHCGVVTAIEPHGYYVRLGGMEGDVDILCTTKGLKYSPKLGSRVIVYITKIDSKHKRIVGQIVYFS